MSERKPITTFAALDILDSVEVLEGYQDGRRGETEPGDNRSDAYWHGWRNGRVDGGHAEIDEAQLKLARDYLKANRASWHPVSA